ncbi:hypothetical protein BKA62DRAFT_704362 [Auriculariales sp. MPI-PUGE-AT-0066]|nr:hypothetical protein BKA62DRAFT_704362 [Auriculariales sp. MPI-PUGE-AT-0066]
MDDRVPEDILIVVFGNVLAFESIEWPLPSYNKECARAPFTLAAVCSRWRHLVTQTSNLWSYFGFPSEETQHEKHLYRLELLITNSKNAPIDVVFNWRASSQCKFEDTPASFDIITKLHMMCPRWRYAEIEYKSDHLKCSLGSRQLHDFEAPFLESLVIIFRGHVPQLPKAPRLRQIFLDSDASDVSFISPLQHPSLVRLIIWSQKFTYSQPYCANHAQQLTYLCIIDDMYHSGNWEFPRLVSLTLDDPLFIDKITAPLIERLAINCSDLNNMSRDAVQHFAHRAPLLTHLVLWGTIRSLITLEPFKSTRTVVFQRPAAVTKAFGPARCYHLQPQVLEELNEREDDIVVWPNLERITFGQHSRSKGARCGIIVDDVLSFIETRNSGRVATAQVSVAADFPGSAALFGKHTDVVQTLS